MPLMKTEEFPNASRTDMLASLLFNEFKSRLMVCLSLSDILGDLGNSSRVGEYKMQRIL